MQSSKGGLLSSLQSPNENLVDPRKEKGKVAGRPMQKPNANAPKRGGRRPQQKHWKKLSCKELWKVPLLPADLPPKNVSIGTPLGASSCVKESPIRGPTKTTCTELASRLQGSARALGLMLNHCVDSSKRAVNMLQKNAGARLFCQRMLCAISVKVNIICILYVRFLIV